jgi:hypothetical protein
MIAISFAGRAATFDVRVGSLADIGAALANVRFKRRKRTSPKAVGMSAKCQKRTHALQQQSYSICSHA